MRSGLFLLIIFVLVGCLSPKTETIMVQPEENFQVDLSALGLPKLSDYGFYKSPIHKLIPTDSLFPYSINASLFSDYAFKRRFIKIPKGKKATFKATEVLEFPTGTILIKNFYYPSDFSKPEEQWRILETRLLINEPAGWKAITYIWNEEQTEAFLDVAGKSVAVNWIHSDGEKRLVNYTIPNMNQCKSCHALNGKTMPIGLTARQLSKRPEREEMNQLSKMQSMGLLEGLPELSSIKAMANYDDENEKVNERARAWLEVNCGHCHRPDGPAKTSGLHLMASITNPMALGLGKAPVAAGKGSGGLLYDIVPGKPDQSIFVFRISSIDPGTMMPELGRTVVHKEGLALIEQWIKEMK